MTKSLMQWLRGRPAQAVTESAADIAGISAVGRGALPAGLHLDITAMQRRAAEAAPRCLSWTRAGISDPLEWQVTARTRLAEISGYGLFGGPPAMLHPSDHELADRGGFHQRSVFIRVRDGRDIPVRLVWDGPAGPPAAWPVTICLQGDGRAMEVSWGEPSPDSSVALAEIDFARQAARRGHLAVCVEMPGAGLRENMGADAAGAAFAVGGSVLGDAASDVASVINWLTQGDCGFAVDRDRITAIGHGSGATVAVLMAAMDERCAAVVAAGGVGPYRTAIGRGKLPLHYVLPGLLQWMDMEDVIALCAPRPVLIQSATDDPLWPASGAERVVRHAEAVYERLGAPQAITAVALPAGKTFDEAHAWDWLAAVTARQENAGQPNQ